ncbi:MAG TPA: hypothetical protein VFT50_15225 [Baekduia sp.]|nr:hypothetical protein [Baekduia sp.]
MITLVLSAIASAVSAYVTSKVWAPGALGAAAMSPVIVALVKEALRKPTDLVSSAVPAPRFRTRVPPRAEELPDDLSQRFGAGAPPPFPPPRSGAPEGPVRVYSTRARRLRWRLALVTGLLGFLLCVLFYTVPEVITGHSVVHSGKKTTLWGGHRHQTSTTPSTTTTTTTSTAPQQQTTTEAPPVRTVTAPPETVTVASPAATTPQTTVPAMPTTATPPPAGGTETAPSG